MVGLVAAFGLGDRAWLGPGASVAWMKSGVTGDARTCGKIGVGVPGTPGSKNGRPKTAPIPATPRIGGGGGGTGVNVGTMSRPARSASASNASISSSIIPSGLSRSSKRPSFMAAVAPALPPPPAAGAAWDSAARSTANADTNSAPPPAARPPPPPKTGALMRDLEPIFVGSRISAKAGFVLR